LRSGESVELEPTCTASTRLQAPLRPELCPRWVMENADLATNHSAAGPVVTVSFVTKPEHPVRLPEIPNA